MRKLAINIALIILSFCYIPHINAAGSATISVTPSSKTVIVGNTVTLTVTISSSVPIAGLQYTIQYDSGILTLESSTAAVNGLTNIDFFLNDVYKKSYTYTFKARKSGVTNVSIVGAEVRDANNEIPVNTYSSRITSMTQQELEATYSKNNNLADLYIIDYGIEPAFNKDITEYNMTVKPETEKIRIVANKEDSRSSIIGDGEFDVIDGVNTFKVEVTAQNGNIKTYTINITVPELNPITVTVDNIDYTVVRAKKKLEYNNSLFTMQTTKIGEEEVPCYYNEITKMTLIALKNSEGEIKYFVENDNNYYEFKEIILGNIDIMVKDSIKTPYNYNKGKVIINDIEYVAYKSNDLSRYYLIYGVNLANNNEGFYSYDSVEGSLQRFDIEILDNMEKENNKNLKTIYILFTTSCLFFIISIILLISKLIKPKKRKNDEKEILNESIDLDDNKSNKKLEQKETKR